MQKSTKRMKKFKFEDKIDVIDAEIKKRRGRWFIKAIRWMDYDDVCQLIRIHIYEKWDQWDQSSPIEDRLNTVIKNRITNLLRDNYLNYCKPCETCPFNNSKETPSGEIGDNLCGWTQSGFQDSECKLYKRWEKKKKYALELISASDVDSAGTANEEHSHDGLFDLENAMEKVHAKMKKILSKKQMQAYKLLFIDKMSEEKVAIKLGFTTNEKGRKAGYKQIKNLKDMFREKIEYILKNNDIIV